MSNGIPGFNAGRINPYRPFDRTEGSREATAPRAETSNRGMPARAALGTDLSVEESRMIEQNFPPSPQMTLRIYSPGKNAHSVNPNGIGSRLDLRG
ncbi:MAG: hypothetical protein WED81_03295 [Rhodothermales bacterium]